MPRRQRKLWKRSLSALRIDRPLRMYQWWRRADPHFCPEESLYTRFEDRGYSEGEPAPATVPVDLVAFLRMPDHSVNRARYSHPKFVLLPDWCDRGILAFPVRSARQFSRTGTSLFELSVIHTPKTGNYAHAELPVVKNGDRVPKDKGKRIPNTIKKLFRENIANDSEVLREPTPRETVSCLRRHVELLKAASQRLLRISE